MSDLSVLVNVIEAAERSHSDPFVSDEATAAAVVKQANAIEQLAKIPGRTITEWKLKARALNATAIRRYPDGRPAEFAGEHGLLISLIDDLLAAA